MIRKGRDGMEKLNMNQPPMELENKTVCRLNDYTEIKIGGVVYRVKSVFSDKGQLDDFARPSGDGENRPYRIKGLCIRV